MENVIFDDVLVRDVRFPTSQSLAGSDAMHTDPDYSCAYVTVTTSDRDLVGHGLTFTLGRGTEIVVASVKAFAYLVKGRRLNEVTDNMGAFYHEFSQESQMRWLGPEKGVTQLALCAILNAIWDIWCKYEKKPLWRLVAEMPAEQLVRCIDFTYITDLLTPEAALDIFRQGEKGLKGRMDILMRDGYPAYCTHCGWLGYSDEKMRTLLRTALKDGWTRFKIKVGSDDIADDDRRLALVRAEIGERNILMVDANEKWNVSEAVERMKLLAKYKMLWIEEPTHPDDILGHLAVSKALKGYGIGVASGEHCANRVLFKQMLASHAIQFCQVDSCRLGSVNEILAVMLMARVCNIPVCPHSGGVGLCELVQHMSYIDFLRISCTTEGRVLEYVDHLHEHFQCPVEMNGQNYIAPNMPGYLVGMKQEAIDMYEFPGGSYWSAHPEHAEKLNGYSH